MNLSGTLNITPKLLEVKRKRYESFKLLTDALERCETNSIQFGEILNVLNNKQHGLFSTLDSVYELQDEIDRLKDFSVVDEKIEEIYLEMFSIWEDKRKILDYKWTSIYINIEK